MANQNFDKFINVKIKGAKKKEQIKQEKKQAKKEREAYFIEKKRADRAAKKLQETSQPPREYDRDKTNKKDFKKDIVLKKQKVEDPNPAAAKTSKTKKNTEPYDKRDSPKKKDIFPKGSGIKIDNPKGPAEQQAKARPVVNQPTKKTFDGGLPFERKPIKKVVLPDPKSKKPASGIRLEKNSKQADEKVPAEVLMPLNKYIAHGGICSRRDAGELVKAGKVLVNGKLITDPGYKVQEGDKVTANGKKVVPQVNLVYILLNKPKDFITTADDPQGRKTVLDIVKSATNERIYPVGRLDRNTSGVLLLTNDGELAQQLTHPSFEVRKIYEAKLDKPLAKADFEKMLNGVTLEDGEVHADSLAYADSKDKSVIGIEIHSGRNRIVRRMFEHLGYDVKALDRVMFANLTKKNVERGKWRFLSEKEVRLLKFFNKSKR